MMKLGYLLLGVAALVGSVWLGAWAAGIESVGWDGGALYVERTDGVTWVESFYVQVQWWGVATILVVCVLAYLVGWRLGNRS